MPVRAAVMGIMDIPTVTRQFFDTYADKYPTEINFGFVWVLSDKDYCIFFLFYQRYLCLFM